MTLQFEHIHNLVKWHSLTCLSNFTGTILQQWEKKITLDELFMCSVFFTSVLGCSLSSFNTDRCPQAYIAHREYLLAQSITDHICQQWSHPLICSPIWKVSIAIQTEKALAASGERPERKEYCHLKDGWELTMKSTNPSINHMVLLHSLKNHNNKNLQDDSCVVSRDGAKCHISANKKDLHSALPALCLVTATDNRLTMHRVHNHAQSGQHCKSCPQMVLPYSHAHKINGFHQQKKM